MVLVTCYDIADDRRRTRLFKRLKGFLHAVQESVFEGHLPVRRLAELRSVVDAEIDHESDTVRIYSLCGSCRRQTMLIGRSPPVPDPSEPILV